MKKQRLAAFLLCLILTVGILCGCSTSGRATGSDAHLVFVVVGGVDEATVTAVPVGKTTGENITLDYDNGAFMAELSEGMYEIIAETGDRSDSRTLCVKDSGMHLVVFAFTE